MSIPVACPHCRSPLPLPQPAPPDARLHCDVCHADFVLNPIPTADPLRVPDLPRSEAAALAGLPPPPALSSPTVPLILATKIRTAQPTAAAPPARRPVAAPRSGPFAAPRGGPLGPVRGAARLAVLFVAVAGGGIALCSALGWARPPVESADVPPANDAVPPANPGPAAATALPSQPLPLPDILVGFWTSRADDGSHSYFDFHADGTAVIAVAGEGRPGPAVRTRWFLTARQGDEYVLDVGPDLDALFNRRFVLRFVTADALTLHTVTFRGAILREGLRFVRRPPPATPPP